ncbi:hypothetical protein BJ968_004399 [Kineococcus aurantiacus]|uniref:Uncharacterized protein n=1 Tax=Kineococcus aurantiacus TaxID=37633 RepID=A0A7Y9DQE0_9ACTN|nr:hypothetical protein [Kineococcus aurantiacus]
MDGGVEQVEGHLVVRRRGTDDGDLLGGGDRVHGKTPSRCSCCSCWCCWFCR